MTEQPIHEFLKKFLDDEASKRNLGFHGRYREAALAAMDALYQHLKPLLDAEDEEINEWQKIKKLGMPEKWIEVYKHYQELLTHEDVANWWQDQFNIANAEREELKSQLSMKGQEIERLKSEIEFRQGL